MELLCPAPLTYGARTVLAGDFNCILDPVLEASVGRTSLSFNQINRLKNVFLQDYLVDIGFPTLPTNNTLSFLSAW